MVVVEKLFAHAFHHFLSQKVRQLIMVFYVVSLNKH